MAASPPTRRRLPPPAAVHTERSLLPIGFTTILPEAAARVRQVEHRLLGAFDTKGYREIILPTFEYLDVLTPGLQSRVLDNGYQLTDRTTGRTLVLRPDATAQIARTVAMGMLGDRLPLRIAYRTSVFRYEPEHVGRDREQLQIGAELIGVPEASGDAEIIALMVEGLRQLGVESFRISLGHVGYLEGLLEQAGLSPTATARAERAASRRDIPELTTLLAHEGVSGFLSRAILEAPSLYGGKDVLARGRRAAGRNRRVSAALDRLAAVYQLLDAAGYGPHLLLDLGELRGFDYYDGIVFDVFADGVGYGIGGGGRYDHLIGRFGRTVPSTGFAFDVDRLFQVLDKHRDDSPSSNGSLAATMSPRARAKRTRRS
ncbi:MAG: ATP phosphoribosyltransferase regulatory subunit [Nitrospiraceae bacterium]